MSNLLTPIIMVVVIGFICAGLLVVASKVFYVEVDERITKVRECLPGANCGGCGFAGCDDYAANLVGDETLPCTKCAPGGADAAAAIAEILGRDAGSTEPQVAQVKCNGECGKSKSILEWQGLKSCKAAKGWFSTPNACMYGCIGLGDCVNVCEFQGIGIVNGVAKVNRTNCVACGMCASVCPQNIIDMVPKKSQVHVLCSSTDKGAVARKNCDNACIGCMKCTKVCNFGAITVENNLARIDYDKCKNCGMCVTQCPTGAINTLKAMDKAAFDKLKAGADKVAAKKAEAAKAAALKAKEEADAKKAEASKAE